MNRHLEIFKTQFKALTIADFLRLLNSWAFSGDQLLVYKSDIDPAAERGIEPITGILIKKGSVEDLERAGEKLPRRPWEFQCHRYDGIEDFFIAENDEGVQHVSWIYLNNKRNRLLSLGNLEAEIKFSLTLPPMRGRGIYPNVIRSIVNYLGKKGIRRVFMCVRPDNLPSIRGIEKAGFRHAGEFRLRKFMGVQISKRFDTSGVQ